MTFELQCSISSDMAMLIRYIGATYVGSNCNCVPRRRSKQTVHIIKWNIQNGQ